MLKEYTNLKIIDNSHKIKLIPLIKSWIEEDYFDDNTSKIDIFTGNWSNLLQLRLSLKVYKKMNDILKSKK